jgi:hypothetical protein
LNPDSQEGDDELSVFTKDPVKFLGGFPNHRTALQDSRRTDNVKFLILVGQTNGILESRVFESGERMKDLELACIDDIATTNLDRVAEG